MWDGKNKIEQESDIVVRDREKQTIVIEMERSVHCI